MATIEISETNEPTVGATSETASITTTNMGSSDSPNIVTTTHVIVAGTNSFEKYQRLHVTDMGTAVAVKNIRVWRTTALNDGETHLTCGATSGYTQKTFVKPTAETSTQALNTMPTSEPATANVGIGGALDGELTAVGYSDYIVHQVQTTAGATAGASCTLNFKYDEIV